MDALSITEAFKHNSASVNVICDKYGSKGGKTCNEMSFSIFDNGSLAYKGSILRLLAHATKGRID